MRWLENRECRFSFEMLSYGIDAGISSPLQGDIPQIYVLLMQDNGAISSPF